MKILGFYIVHFLMYEYTRSVFLLQKGAIGLSVHSSEHTNPLLGGFRARNGRLDYLF